MYLVTLVVCCCSGDSGFDGTVCLATITHVGCGAERDTDNQVMGGINSMVQYQRYFGMTGVGSKTRCVRRRFLSLSTDFRLFIFCVLLGNQHRVRHIHCVRPLYRL